MIGWVAHHQILGLDVRMHVAIVVQVLQNVQDLTGDHEQILLVHPLVHLQHGMEVVVEPGQDQEPVLLVSEQMRA